LKSIYGCKKKRKAESKERYLQREKDELRQMKNEKKNEKLRMAR
jgi:hypothetical protein